MATLFFLVLSALLLSWALADPAAAHNARSTLFQSAFESPLTPTTVPSAPVTPPPVQTGAPPGPPTPTLTSAAPAASPTASPTLLPSPTASATLPPSPTATPIGFLPPPTLTSPETPTPQALPTRVSVLETPLAARAARSQTPTPSVGGSPILSGLLGSGVTALGYLWLVCGIVLLIAAALAVVWLVRRQPPAQ